MNRTEYCACRLWGLMQHWLGWRQGRCAGHNDCKRCSVDEQADQWLNQLGRNSFEYPRDLAVIACRILAEARQKPRFQFYRELLEAGADPLAEIPWDSPESYILAIHYQTKEARKEAATQPELADSLGL